MAVPIHNRRAGFTLVEMLIATGIFLVGFVSVYSLFLSGVKFRRESENTARGAVAASSVVARIRHYSALDSSLPPPSRYNGDGIPDATEAPDTFFAFPDQPGMFYRVTDSAYLFGGNGAAIKLAVQTVFLGAPQATLSAEQVAHRLGRRGATVAELVADRLIHEQVAVIYRR